MWRDLAVFMLTKFVPSKIVPLFSWSVITFSSLHRVISKSMNGLFCVYCSVFNHSNTGTGSKNTMPLKCLVTEPLTKFAKLLGKDSYLETHSRNIYHKNAVQDGKSFLHVYNNPQNKITNELNIAHYEQAKENRSRLKPIIDSLIFLGKQNIAIRGHRDYGSIFDNSQKPTENNGNFRISSERTCIIENLILKNVLERVKQSKFYSVIFDETIDVSKISQLVTVIRYVHKNEDFVGFLDCHQDNYKNTEGEVEPKITGENIGNSVLNILKKLDLPFENCVGITTDGCSVMLSKKCGAVKTLKEKMKNAFKCTCFSHALNLSIMKGCKIKFVRNIFGIMREIINFFNTSAKKNYILKNTLKSSLHSLCETKWVEKHYCVLQFFTGLSSIIKALDKISDWDDINTASKASSLSKSASSGEFILTLITVSEMFTIISPVSKLLQSKSQDKFSATIIIENVANLGISIEINKPRLSEVMKNRENPQTQSVEEYFRITLFIPFLDNLLYDLESRFDEDLMSVFDLDVVLPNIVKIKSFFDNKFKLENKIKNVINQFGDLVACEINIPRDIFESSIIGEFELWHNYWLQEEQLPSSPLEAIKRCYPDLFSGIHVLLKILITLSATSATAERNFSSLRRVKTWMRSRISEERLNGLVLSHAHRDAIINHDEVIDVFAQSNRRLDFVI
ncbi:hypothetical protein QTP88_002786 [Uroleucon formosanum]